MNLNTTYLGMVLQNPLVVSPSPLCGDLDNLKQMEDAGAAAIIMQSLFEEQILLESLDLDMSLSVGEESQSEAASYFPDLPEYGIGPDAYLEHIRRAKESVAIPVLGSLNGVSAGGWTRYAKLIEEAGADALELNVYSIPTDPEKESAEVEGGYTRLVEEVKDSVSIPVAVKIGPYFSSLANMAEKLEVAGADALVLFNRFYQPDLDIETLEVTPNLVLSSSEDLRLRLRWLAILHGRIGIDLALTGGVHCGTDAIKAVMAGAKVAMTTSALLKKGISRLGTLRREMIEWMEEHEYESVEQMYGSMSQKSVADPAAFERANYMQVIKSYAP